MRRAGGRDSCRRRRLRRFTGGWWPSAPCTLATKAGIKIGSAAAAVAKAYAHHLDKENPPTAGHLVVGTIYGGIIFDFDKGKVTSIFIGAAAE